MNTMRTFTLSLLLSLACAAVVTAQTERAARRATPADPTVTVSVSTKGVRFAAPGAVGQMRLEVFDAAGVSVYSSEFQPGTVRDWSPQDKAGQPLADGAYACVVTLRDLAGRLVVKQGSISVQGGRAALQLGETAQVGAIEPEQALAPVTEAAGTLVLHDGTTGRVVSTRGPLTFRVGNFFAGLDREQMRLTEEGDLGVGTKKPQAKLDVAGDIRAAGLLRVAKGIEFADGTVQTTGLAGRTDAQGNIVPAAAGSGTQGRLAKWTETGGAGTLSDALLEEAGSNILHRGNSFQMTAPPSSGIETNLLYLDATNKTMGVLAGNVASFTATSGPYFVMRGNSFTTFPNQRGLFSISAGQVSTPVGSEGAIQFVTGADQLQMIIKPNGNIGIGTNTPQSKLDVAGDLQVSGNAVVAGNIAAKYQDVAEWVPARGHLAPGTVVMLDVARRNGVVASARAYNTHVAGVVSAQPGVILGQGGAGQVLVATTGRVLVKVDATRHAIRVGDLLVTSNSPGLAMRSQPLRIGNSRLHRPGTIIGKALEPLAGGTGEILVLLSLQ